MHKALGLRETPPRGGVSMSERIDFLDCAIFIILYDVYSRLIRANVAVLVVKRWLWK